MENVDGNHKLLAAALIIIVVSLFFIFPRPNYSLSMSEPGYRGEHIDENER